LSLQKISDTQGNFTGQLHGSDYFGRSVAGIGDLNENGVPDIVVGAIGDNFGGTDRGVVYVLFLNTDGSVKSHQKISDTQGRFTGQLDNGDQFGISVGRIGDLNGDGVPDIVVGAYLGDDGGADRGAVWILNFPACTIVHSEVPTEVPTTSVPTTSVPTETPTIFKPNCKAGLYSFYYRKASTGEILFMTCNACPSGKHSSFGSLTCSTCEAGYCSILMSENCAACDAGTYSNATAASCTPCPTTAFSLPG